MIDRDHPLVGTAVVYRPWNQDVEPEQGVVTAVNVDADAVFVRYGSDVMSKNTPPSRLRTLSGVPITLERRS